MKCTFLFGVFSVLAESKAEGNIHGESDRGRGVLCNTRVGGWWLRKGVSRIQLSSLLLAMGGRLGGTESRGEPGRKLLFY